MPHPARRPGAEWLPELAEPRVLADPAGPLDDTVPAARPITVRDLLTFRMGAGWDFTAAGPAATDVAAAEAGLATGPPAPAGPPEPDEWMRRFGAIPLTHQPGTRWLYHTSADVLGVLVARAAGRPLGDVLAERIFEPLGMADTGFWVPPASNDRLGACHMADPTTGEVGVYDPPEGQWSRPPAFPGGGDGLVSTLDDFHAFADMLRVRWQPWRAAHPVAGRGGGHDHQPPLPRPARAGGPRPGRHPGLGLRGRRPAGAHRSRPRRSGPTGGTAASAPRGPTTRSRT